MEMRSLLKFQTLARQYKRGFLSAANPFLLQKLSLLSEISNIPKHFNRILVSALLCPIAPKAFASPDSSQAATGIADPPLDTGQ